MDAGRVVPHLSGKNNNLSPRVIWLVGAIAVCRGVFGTFFPAIRRMFNV